MTQCGNGLSILVVDDDPFILNLAVNVLGRLGHERVDTANDGNIALEKLATHKDSYDTIILDLNMPEMDGIKFMRHAKGSGFNGGIILLSGEDKRMLDTAISLAKSQKLGVLGALSKPMELEAVKALLDNFEPNASEPEPFCPQEPISLEDLKDGIRGSAENHPLLVYQPKISIQTGEIVGVETLARWWNRDRGVLGPGTFIPLAEESETIDSLTYEIYRKAIAQLATWNKQGLDISSSVNFSVNSFSKQEFCDFLISTAQEYEVSPQQITLEVTETQAMAIAVDCLEALLGMRLKRFSLSIDDFGTGSSSMAQLKDIPFTELKIDRAFVHGASHDAGALAILETSINLARKLGMQIVAEGAETREDWNMVEQLGCDYVQGFYCAKPMPNEELLEFIEKWSGPH